MSAFISLVADDSLNNDNFENRSINSENRLSCNDGYCRLDSSSSAHESDTEEEREQDNDNQFVDLNIPMNDCKSQQENFNLLMGKFYSPEYKFDSSEYNKPITIGEAFRHEVPNADQRPILRKFDPLTEGLVSVSDMMNEIRKEEESMSFNPHSTTDDLNEQVRRLKAEREKDIEDIKIKWENERVINKRIEAERREKVKAKAKGAEAKCHPDDEEDVIAKILQDVNKEGKIPEMSKIAPISASVERRLKNLESKMNRMSTLLECMAKSLSD